MYPPTYYRKKMRTVEKQVKVGLMAKATEKPWFRSRPSHKLPGLPSYKKLR